MWAQEAMTEQPPWPHPTTLALRPEPYNPPPPPKKKSMGKWLVPEARGPPWAWCEINSPSWAGRGDRGPLRVKLRTRFHGGNRRSKRLGNGLRSHDKSSQLQKSVYGQDKTDRNFLSGQDKTYKYGLRVYDSIRAISRLWSVVQWLVGLTTERPTDSQYSRRSCRIPTITPWTGDLCGLGRRIERRLTCCGKKNKGKQKDLKKNKRNKTGRRGTTYCIGLVFCQCCLL